MPPAALFVLRAIRHSGLVQVDPSQVGWLVFRRGDFDIRRWRYYIKGQFRAFEWIVNHADRIAHKRNIVQRMRRRSDQEIFQRFPLHLVPTYPGDEALMNSALFRLLRPPLPSVEKNLGDIMRIGNPSS